MNSYKNKRNMIHLLPNYFKWVGLFLLLVVILFQIAINTWDVQSLNTHKEIIKTWSINFFIVGLVIIGFTGDKVEDEMVMLLRFKALAFSFMAAVVYVIIQSIFDRMGGNAKAIDSNFLIVSMLITYIIFFFILKKFR